MSIHMRAVVTCENLRCAVLTAKEVVLGMRLLANPSVFGPGLLLSGVLCTISALCSALLGVFENENALVTYKKAINNRHLI